MSSEAAHLAALPLVPLIYSAIDEPDRWKLFLQEFTRAVNTRTGFFWISRIDSGDALVAATTGVSQEALSALADPAYRDPWISRVDLATVPIGLILRSNEICPDEILIHDEWFQRLCVPNHFHYGGGVMLERNATVSAGMSTNRPKDGGPMTDAELDVWRALVPHLTAAVRLFARQAKLEGERDALMRYFDDLGHGIVLTTASMQVIAANERARLMAERGRGLSISGPAIRSLHPACQSKFAEAIRRAASQPIQAARVLLRQSDGEASVMATILSVGGATQPSISPDVPTAVIYLIDLEDRRAYDPEPLRHLFGFTAAEAQLACCVASGDSLAEASARLNVSINTSRSHLQRACAKAGVHRQAELAITVLKVCAPIGGLRA